MKRVVHKLSSMREGLEDRGYVCLSKLRQGMRNLSSEIIEDESGMGTIEMVLLIVVLIALVIIFKDSISAVLEDIMSQIESNSSSVYS